MMAGLRSREPETRRAGSRRLRSGRTTPYQRGVCRFDRCSDIETLGMPLNEGPVQFHVARTVAASVPTPYELVPARLILNPPLHQ